uniref:Uncharacterized protein n=1 Tax=Cacopsylla melanoneura TaxID=428564 RepID=A0A8D8VAH3_9HEMI
MVGKSYFFESYSNPNLPTICRAVTRTADFRVTCFETVLLRSANHNSPFRNDYLSLVNVFQVFGRSQSLEISPTLESDSAIFDICRSWSLTRFAPRLRGPWHLVEWLTFE